MGVVFFGGVGGSLGVVFLFVFLSGETLRITSQFASVRARSASAGVVGYCSFSFGV